MVDPGLQRAGLLYEGVIDGLVVGQDAENAVHFREAADCDIQKPPGVLLGRAWRSLRRCCSPPTTLRGAMAG
jgi:hypothetical protein